MAVDRGSNICYHHFEFATTTATTPMNREMREAGGGVEAEMQNS